MADKRADELTEDTSPLSTDITYVEHDPSGTQAPRKVQLGNLNAAIGAALKANNLSDLANAGTARTNLGLGTIATQAANSVTITGGSVSGITDIAVADGGTGASNAAAARTNLGLAIGTDVQAHDSDLDSIAALTTTSYGRGALEIADAASMITYLGLPTLTTSDTGKVPISTSGGLTTLDVSKLFGSTADISDASWAMADNLTPSKRMVFELSGITASTTRTMTIPDADGVVVLDTATQTVSNKALTDATTTNSLRLGPASVTYTSLQTGWLIGNTITTLDFSAALAPPVIQLTGNTVIAFNQTGGTSSIRGVQFAPTVQNVTGVAANLSATALGSSGRIFEDASLIRANSASITAGAWISFRSAPTYSITAGGTITDLTLQGFTFLPNLGSGVTSNTGVVTGFNSGAATVSGSTITTYNHMKIASIGSGGTVTTQYGIDIAALSNATTNVGIRNSSTLRQVAAATFGADAAVTSGVAVDIQAGTFAMNRSALTYASPTSVDVTLGNVFTVTTVNATGSVTFNATAAGKAGTQITLIITNDATSNKTITFGTNFRSTATLVGTTSKTAVVVFTSDGSNWIETSRTTAIT